MSENYLRENFDENKYNALGEKDILDYIFNIYKDSAEYYEDTSIYYKTIYSYGFANILKAAFPEGEVCVLARTVPQYFVFKKGDWFYTINGVICPSEVFHFVPISYLEPTILNDIMRYYSESDRCKYVDTKLIVDYDFYTYIYVEGEAPKLRKCSRVH